MKKSNQKFLTVFYLLATVFASCTYSNYIPMTVTEPMLKEAGEKQATVFLGSNHVEVQGAYAIAKHVGIMGDIWAGYDKRYSVELLPGYFYSSPNGFCAGFYAGAGIANTTGEVSFHTGLGMGEDEHYINDTRYTSLMWQPGVGYRTKNFEIGFASRVSYMAFTRYSTWYEATENSDSKLILRSYSYHNDNFTTWVFQPAINVSYGLEHVKAFFSIGGNIPIGDTWQKGRVHPTYPYYSLSTGLKIDLFRHTKSGN
jgi:hypothetical protein